MFALPVAYQVFRMGYYASLVANTAYAKQATAVHWSRGWRYLREFVDDYILWLPLVAIAVLTLGRYLRAARTPPPDASRWCPSRSSSGAS